MATGSRSRLNSRTKAKKSKSLRRNRVVRVALESLEPRINLTSYIWSGAVSDNWSDPGNWQGGAAPINDPTADLFFTATGDTSPFNDIVNGTFNSIEIDALGYTIQGNSLSLNAGITGTFTTGRSHFIPAITLTAPQSFQSASSDATGLDIQSPINTGSFALTVGGTGNTTFRLGVISGGGSLSTSGTATVHMQGAQANTYSGTTTVASGTLLDLNSAAVAVPGNLTINGGTVTLARNSEIASTSAVGLSGSNAKLDLQGHTQTIGTLNDAGATLDTVALGAGTLTIGGSSASTFGGSISGSGGSLTVSGSGTVTLNGTSSYTGTTTVSNGTLLVNGSTSTSATLRR